MSTFETDMLPGECPHKFAAAANELRLREMPSTTSRTLKPVKVALGQSLAYDETRYRTIHAGHIRVLAPSRVNGRMIGPVRRLSAKEYYSNRFIEAKIEVKPGMDIEYLQYRAEATCFVRIGLNVVDASPCPDIDKSKFKVETEPSQ